MNHTHDDKLVRYNSVFLGVLMFTFGVLKYFQPFRTMFAVQVTESGLPRLSIPLGKVAEMAIGGGLLVPACLRKRMPLLYGPTVVAASAGLMVNMGIATYVHLHPKVPAKVLPLGIKPPIIPLLVMVLAVVNLHRAHRGDDRRFDGHARPRSREPL